MNKSTKLKIVMLFIILGGILSFIFIPNINSTLKVFFTTLKSMDVDMVAEYIRSFGIYAVIISICLMMFQSVIAPLPAFLITFANAIIFGWWQGAIISWSGAMAGAFLCFFIARIFGRDAVSKLSGKFAFSQIDVFFNKYGKHTVLICRLLPFVSFDFISYGAGLTAISFKSFFIATGIGQLPATIVYSYVGGMLSGGARLMFTALLILFALSILIYMLKNIYDKSHS